MAVSLKHAFTSAVPDGGDTSLVQPSNWNAEHTLTAGANTLLGAVTAGAVGEITCTAAGRALIDDADAAAQRTTLGLGTIATQASSNVSITGGSITGITDLAVADGGTGASTLTGYVKGNGTSAMTASATIPNTDITGLGTMSTQAASNVAITGGSITGITDLAVADGGTGASTANAGLTNLTTLTSTATAAGTTTLTNTSTYFQLFTGTTTQTVVLPVTSTLATGWTFHIINNSTGNLTVNSSGGNLVVTVIPGTTAMVTCIGTTLTTAADWEAGLTDFSTYTGTGSVVLANDPVFSTGIRIGTGGTLAAGSIYSNANWGMLFQAKQASPALGDYALLNSAGTIRMAINASGALGVGSTPSYGTSGQSLISGGTGAAPAWGTLGVSGGGTGVTSATAYALLAGGTTSTGAFQSLGTGTAGQVLTSNGASALPTWAAGPATPTLTSYTSGSGNWTIPSSGTFALVRAWGGGGSGGRGGGTAARATGGGGGGYAERLYKLSDLGAGGATVAYSVAAGGTAVSVAGLGNPGGNSTFASGANLLTAYGGGAGTGDKTNMGGGGGGGALSVGGAGGDGVGGTAGAVGGGVGSQGTSGVTYPVAQWGGGGGGGLNTSTAIAGSPAFLGGGGGGAAGTATASGGTSVAGGAGGASSIASGTPGTSGSAPGGGGGAQGANGGSSGAGGAGRIEIWVW